MEETVWHTLTLAVAATARLVLGTVYLLSAVPKLRDRSAFVQAVAGYRILPSTLTIPFAYGLPWIELPVFQDDGYPSEDRGVVPAEPGLFFVGLAFQRAASSTLIGGVGRDAEFIARQISARSAAVAREHTAREPQVV